MLDSEMTSRQRVLASLSHQSPDRVPIDLGSTIVTGISIQAYNRLRSYLGLPLGETKVFDRAAQTAVVDEDVLDLFGIDTRGIIPGLPENRASIEHEEADMFEDEWGLVRKYSEQTYTYFVVNAPLTGEISLHEIRNYPWPDPSDPGRIRGMKQEVAEFRQQGDWAILLSLPANFILVSMLLRGFEQWYLDCALAQDLLEALLDQILEIQMAMCEKILYEAGDLVDVVVNFDDLAMQDRLMISMPAYRKLLEPRLFRLYEFIRSKTSVKILHHTDGAVEPLLASLIEMGIDAVNPVQVSARGMNDTQGLKDKYGDQLAFWGAIDTQHVLPFGSTDEVQREVTKRISDLNQDGGYVLCSVHNIQDEVPPQNIVKMYETALDRPIQVA